MFGSNSEDSLWKEGFKDFMRSTRMVKEDTIESYIDYIEKVAARIGKRCVDLAGSNDRLNETIQSLDAVIEWNSKTKSNYKVALNRFNAYLMSLYGVSGKDVSRGDESVSPDSSNRNIGESKETRETMLLAQINEIEKMAREHEDKTWNSVFKCVSAYALGMPSVVIALGVNMWGCLLAVLSAVCAFGGIAALIPVLQRPSRQLKEIQDYGERLHFEGKQFGCVRPVEWTLWEKWSIAISAIALLASVLCLGLAKVVGS